MWGGGGGAVNPFMSIVTAQPAVCKTCCAFGQVEGISVSWSLDRSPSLEPSSAGCSEQQAVVAVSQARLSWRFFRLF